MMRAVGPTLAFGLVQNRAMRRLMTRTVALLDTLTSMGCGGPGTGGSAGTIGSAGGSGRGGTTGSAGTSGSAGVSGRGGSGGSAGTSGGAGGSGGGAGASGGGAGAGGSAGASGRGGSGGAGTGGAAGASGRGGSGGAGGAAGRGGSNGGSGGTAGAGGSAGAAGRGGTGGSAAGSGGAGGSAGGSGAGGSGGATASYDQMILADGPVAYWAMNKLSSSEPDLTGNNHTGTYHSGATTAATLPNGDTAADFDGSSQYVSVPSSNVFSVPATGSLTWEAWIRPDVLQFPNDTGGYVDWMGKCQDYGPTCEWEARMYSTTNSESRPNRMSAYIFNTSAGLGSAADWQPANNLIQPGTWYHIVGEYTTTTQPSDCQNASTYPGMIDIWVNGVKWNHGSHGQTGCMSQYNVVPTASTSPLNIGTMAMDAWFPGAIGKVAIYDKLLSAAQVTAHYTKMKGTAPTGSCAATCSF
jgi:hypothetical protein